MIKFQKRIIIVNGYLLTIASATAAGAGSATITCTESIAAVNASTSTMYPGEAGAEGRDIYSTLMLGSNAYGTVDIEGGGLETIVKQLGSAGTSDPLNQRATVGWKAIKTAKRLVETWILRIETACTFNHNLAN